MSTRTISVYSTKSTESGESRPAGLPITHDLTLGYILSLMVALIMAVASIAGLLYHRVLYPADELLLSFLPSDGFNFAVGLPILLGSTWLARYGKLIGLLCWPGALFYVVYMYIPYALAVPFNVLFLPYLVIVILSAYTLIRILASIDGESIRQRLSGFVPARISAGILIGLAIFIILRQTALVVTALTTQTSVGIIELSAWIADFTVAIPMLLIAGIQLWRRRALGYAAGAGMLLGYGMLALSVIPFFVFQARQTGSPIDAGGLVAILVMAALCFIPLAFFVRGAASGRSSSFDNLNATRIIATTIGVFFGLFSGVNHGIFGQPFIREGGTTPTWFLLLVIVLGSGAELAAGLALLRREGYWLSIDALRNRIRLRWPKGWKAWALAGIVLILGMGLSMAMEPVNGALASVPGFTPPLWWPAASNPTIEVRSAADVFPDINLEGNYPFVFLYLVIGLVFNIFGEEIYYRGYLLPRMRAAFGRWDWVANAVLFTLKHVYQRWLYPGILVGGLCYAFAAGPLGSLPMAMVYHWAGNFLFQLVFLIQAAIGAG